MNDDSSGIEIWRLSDPSDLDFRQMHALLRVLSPRRAAEVTAETVGEEIKNPAIYLFVASKYDEREIYLGTAKICFHSADTGTGWRAEIHDVVRHPDVRGQGMGAALMEQCIDVAREFCRVHGLSEIEISLTSNPDKVAANALYPRLGFQLVGSVQRPGRDVTNLYSIVVRVDDTEGLS